MRVLEDRYSLYNMAKKKRTKKKPQFTDSSDEGELSSCRHIARSVSLPNVRKALKLDPERTCVDCAKDGNSAEDGEDKSTWFCLQCGYQGCGRFTKCKHALKHSERSYSDSHRIAVNTVTGIVWCYDCDDEVTIGSNNRLEDAVKAVKNQFTPSSSFTTSKTKASVVARERVTSSSNLATPKLKGLSNLGNTCFFNAVIQSMCQVKEFHHLLMNSESNSATWNLPGFQELSSPVLDDSDEESNDKIALFSSLEPLEVQLGENGALTKSLLKLFKDMSSETEKSTLSPQNVFRQISSNSPRFKGYQQQDSHELLMNLLDGLIKEEEIRIKKGILSKFGVNGPLKKSGDDLITAAKIKSYGHQAKHTTVDALFGGYLLSTVLCKDCKQASQIFEPFLDLSLPLYEEKTRRGSRKYSSSVDDTETLQQEAKISKHQMKKNRKAAHKGKRSSKSFQPENSVTDDADVELEGLDEAEHSDKETEVVEAVPESEAKVKSEEENSDLMSETSSSSKSGQGYNSDNEGKSVASDSENLSSAACRDPIGENSLSNGISKLSLEACNVKKQLLPRAIEMSLKPLATRQESHPHECSVLSCLGQFTHHELLTGTNKFACTNCTKLARKRNSFTDGQAKNSTIYTNASKQLLIFQPPAILILHLKRFQQLGFSLSKVNRHVQFDMQLDLAPFCSSLSKGVRGNQQEILYNLFAVVEHSGRLHTGHYTAYVRHRSATNLHKEFLQTSLFKKKPSCVLIERLKEMNQACMAECDRSDSVTTENADENISTVGKWFHISDSHVKEVTERTVLGCQAYILFYERIR